MKSSVELLNFNNNFNDLTVVNSARVSFNKSKEVIDDSDIRLINYLVKHNHWSPLAHPHATISMPYRLIDYDDLIMQEDILAGLSLYHNVKEDTMEVTGSLWAFLKLAVFLESKTILDICHEHCPISTTAFLNHTTPEHINDFIKDTDVIKINPSNHLHDIFSFRMTTPIYVARQLVKHQQKLVWNEISGRYVKLDIGIERRDVGDWNAPADNVKQGSSPEIVLFPNSAHIPICKPDGLWQYHEMGYNDICKLAKQWYDKNDGCISNEQRRAILPLSTYTSWIWTGTRKAFNRVVDQRTKDNAQQETREVVEIIESNLKLKPWNEVKENNNGYQKNKTS
jgi:thymidylate synthase ThyX